VKIKTVFNCQKCGYQSPKWLGKCPDCGEWGSLVEEEETLPRREGERGWDFEESLPKTIEQIELDSEQRIKTRIAEFDRVLGGGVVRGSVILVGGDPGIGKSTLLLQVLNQLGSEQVKVLYISGEESVIQTKVRAERINVNSPHLYILTENNLERIIKIVKELKPQILVIDSIQTVYSLDLQSAPGSISQVRDASGKIIFLSKANCISTFLIGHVTKEGAIAGPRVLEHMVDTVLYFEGDRGHPYRILRAVKNRFGSTNEIGVFEMKDTGLTEVLNPSEIFLAGRPEAEPGSVVVPSLEGSRPILVEVQALVSPTSFGMPRRMAMGVDPNRLSLLAAVLERKVGMKLYNQDIYLNIAGGLRISEPAVDLGLVCAVASSLLDMPVDHSTVIFGEVGLAGEVRAISQSETRVKEAEKLGFKRCILPKNNEKRFQAESRLELFGVSSIEEVLGLLFRKGSRGQSAFGGKGSRERSEQC